MTRRDQLSPLIRSIIEDVGTDDVAALRRALRESRPGVVRQTSWGQKVWYSEIKRQLGSLLDTATFWPDTVPKPAKPMPGQRDLFGGDE